MISKGTVVTCEDCGKQIASTARSVKSAEKMSRGDLDKFRIEQPKDDDDIARVECPDCGGKWMRGGGGKNIQVHTEKYGWQPGEDKDLK